MQKHFKKVCKHDNIKSQCRCPGDKVVYLVSCEKSFCPEAKDYDFSKEGNK